MSEPIAVTVPEDLIEAIARRVVDLLREHDRQVCEDGSPWLDFEARSRLPRLQPRHLYKLTAARAIPFRKKAGGQGLRFHRDELDAWMKTAYPQTGSAPLSRAMVDRVSETKPATGPSGRTVSSATSIRAGLPRRRPVPRHPGIYYRPRPDGKVASPYELAYLDSSGRRRWQVIHGSLEDAEAKRAELRLRRRRGERIEPTRQIFAEYAREWLERQDVRPRTREKYKWALERHLIPRFGRRRLDQITCEDIASFIAEMRKKGLKGWTITSALRPLSLILGQAARKGRIPVNPMSQLERGERPQPR